jgi:hypothetical protein
MPVIRGIARTAVIAGTATAVSNRVSRRQSERWAQQDQANYYEQEPSYQQAPPPPPAAPAQPDKFEQLRQLGDLKTSGVRTDAEFEAQKAKILAG